MPSHTQIQLFLYNCHASQGRQKKLLKKKLEPVRPRCRFAFKLPTEVHVHPRGNLKINLKNPTAYRTGTENINQFGATCARSVACGTTFALFLLAPPWAFYGPRKSSTNPVINRSPSRIVDLEIKSKKKMTDKNK